MLPGHDLLIVSDLHLSEGRSPKTKKVSPNEDFFFDEEFARFLGYYTDQTRWPGKKWHLIVNGDFVDFLQVTTTEDSPAHLSRDPKHPEYGLGCGAQETVYKLKVMMDGHWQFFGALAEFVASGNILTIGKGNHDVEFHYEEVRGAFRDELRKVYMRKLQSEGNATRQEKLARLNDVSIRFIDWFYYEPGLLWVEHGNQYDALNSFEYWLAPLLPAIPGWDPARKDDIDLPWGSLFVRYLFNKVEVSEPFADNIKPQTKFIRWFITRHPALAVRFLFTDGRYMLTKMRRAWKPVLQDAYAQRERDHLDRLRQLATESGIAEADLQAVDGLRAHSVLRVTRGFLWDLFHWLIRFRLLLVLVFLFLFLLAIGGILIASFLLSPVIPEVLRRWFLPRSPLATSSEVLMQALSVVRWLLLPLVALGIGRFLKWLLTAEKGQAPSYLAQRARDICGQLKVRYVMMGHTHDTDLQSIGPNGEEYFNTGTWTKVFSEEERLIREENELVFVQAVRKNGGLKAKLLKWNDQAGEPRLVKLFWGWE